MNVPYTIVLMPDATITIGILAFIAFAIPVVGAMWRIFSVREALQTAIANNSHRLDLLERDIKHLIDQQIEAVNAVRRDISHLHDQQELAINGTREVAQHVRDRSARAEEKLSDRIVALERYLDKTTDFSPRNKD